MAAREIDEIFEFIGRLEPDLCSKMVGASDAEIDVLEAIVGLEFCASYRAWLRHVGNTARGALDVFLGSHSFTIADAQEFHDQLAADGFSMPPDVVFFYHRYYQFERFVQQHGDLEADPAVVSIYFEDELPAPLVEVWDPSFASYLVNDAFTNLFMMRQEICWTMMPIELPEEEAAARARAHEIAGHLGFSPIPHSTGSLVCLQRGGVGLIIGRDYGYHPSTFTIWTAGRDAIETRRVAEVFSDHLGVPVKRGFSDPNWGRS